MSVSSLSQMFLAMVCPSVTSQELGQPLMEEQPDPAIEAQRATAASAYEQERAVCIARNRERLAQIGV